MSSPERKKRKKEWSPTLQSSPVLSLPYDLLLSCVARVSRLYYPTLSLVSKSFRSLIASPELYKARSELGHTESCLYVGIQPIGDPGLTWYTLCKRPSGYVLATVSIPDYPRARFPGLVAVGSDIYNIGGSDLQSLCKGNYSRVTILDCRSHTWREAPSLRVGLCLLSASVIDGKIYVAGRCKVGVSGTKNSFEVFDTEAQFWDTLPSETQGGGVVFDSTTSIEGKFHVMTDQEAVAYDPKKGRWDLDLDGKQMGPRMIYNGYCEIDNVLYSASRGGPFAWYDTEVRMWRRLMGLVGLPKLTSESNVRLANYRGKLGVLWEGKVFSFGRWRRLKKKIWCAVIALERRNTSEIWGKLQWLDHVLTVPAETRVIEVSIYAEVVSIYPDNSFDVIYSRDTILHIQDKPALFKTFFKWLKPGGKVLITDYCRSAETPSPIFAEYIKQRGYDLHDVQAYGQMLRDAGFEDVIAEDRTDQFVQVLRRELERVEKEKEEFISDFSEEDYNDIVGGLKSKLERSSSGEQKWGLFIANKK